MVDATWSLDESHGELLVRTDVTGRAAKIGHRLTIAMQSWQATVSWSGGKPAAVDLSIEVDSLQVLRGDGGLTPLSAPEKVLVRSNALKCLDADRYRRIHFCANDIAESRDGYRLTGTLTIRDRARQHVLDVHVVDGDDSWRLRGDTGVRQSDYGVKPYSMLMGSMKVADTVTVSFTATQTKNAPT